MEDVRNKEIYLKILDLEKKLIEKKIELEEIILELAELKKQIDL